MGAYENPQIIQQPDYGEIFRRNFQASYQQTEAVLLEHKQEETS